MMSLTRTQRHPSDTMHEPRRSPTRAPRRIARFAVLMSVLVGTSACLAAPALAAPETPTTEAPSAITANSATLKGTLNPNASGTAGYYFNYGKNGSCEEISTTPGAEATGKGIAVSTPVTGLEGNTEYMVCVVATHEGEPTQGLSLPFTTLAAKPTAAGGEAYGITPFAASANTFVNPENQTTSCEFEYGTTLPSAQVVPCEPASLGGKEAQLVTGVFGGLTPKTTYHYRIVATNATGTTTGTAGQFTTLTLEAPKIESQSSTNVTSSGATLEAVVNPNYQETTYEFEYATNPALTGAKTAAGESPLPAEFAELPVSLSIAGLQPETTYYYRAVATNGTAKTDGNPVLSFTTQATPAITTNPAQQVTRTTAEVSGTVNPNGLATSWHIAYIDQAGYEAAGGATAANPYAGGRVTANVALTFLPEAAHKANNTYPELLSELTPEMTYHFAVVATNSLGTTIGPDMTFTTSPPTPATVVTGDAVEVTQTSARLIGAVNTQGLPTTVYFEFGNTPALGAPQWTTISPSSENIAAFSLPLQSLQPGTTYYYRASASNVDNAGGPNRGAVKSFTTASFPAPPTLSSPPLLTVTLTGLTTSTPPKVSTPKKSNAKKLTKALKVCAKKPKSKRAACKRRAHKKYGK